MRRRLIRQFVHRSLGEGGSSAAEEALLAEVVEQDLLDGMGLFQWPKKGYQGHVWLLRLKII